MEPAKCIVREKTSIFVCADVVFRSDSGAADGFTVGDLLTRARRNCLDPTVPALPTPSLRDFHVCACSKHGRTWVYIGFLWT
jgi:hypothetical protein